ncbi:MAG: hypothetical protein QXF15_02530 [Candidatus Aenigmatarchaeota archaeon]
MAKTTKNKTRKNKNIEFEEEKVYATEGLIKLIKAGMSFNKILKEHKDELKASKISLHRTEALRALAKLSAQYGNVNFANRRKYEKNSKKIKYTVIKDKYGKGYKYLYRFICTITSRNEKESKENKEANKKETPEEAEQRVEETGEGYVFWATVHSDKEYTYDEALKEAEFQLEAELTGDSSAKHTPLVLYRAYYYPHGLEFK